MPHSIITESNRNAAIKGATDKANAWLAPFDLCLEVEAESNGDGRVGEYEAGSVFEKSIRVVIFPDEIVKWCFEEQDTLPFSEITSEKVQTQVTIYHELGHALVEQIIDWMEYLPEADEIFTDEFCRKYGSVVDDDIDEETLVEDFAYAFMYDKADPLKACFEELNKIFEIL